MYSFRHSLIALATATSLTVPLAAHDYRAGSITIDHPWARVTAEGQSAGGGFMIIRNTGQQADILLGGSTPVAREVQVHEMAMTDGMMRMQQLRAGLSIPAGGTVELRPGSFHIMFMGLRQPLVAGTRVPVTLRFRRAGTVRVDFTVQAMGGTPAAGEHRHGQ